MPVMKSGNFVQTGTVDSFAQNAVPNGWLECNGALVSRTAYAALFLAIGTTYGVGDGATTFALPDLRGEFIRGHDNGRGVDTGRVFAAAQLDSLQNLTGLADQGGGIGILRSSGSGVFGSGGATTYFQNAPAVLASQQLKFDASLQARTSTETRGRNVAMKFCIKY